MPRVVVLSDVHGNLQALQAVWNDLRHRAPEHILFLGDLVALGPQPAETLAYLRDEVKPTVALRGETDRYLLEKVWKGKKGGGLEPELLEGLRWTAEAIGDEGFAYLDTLSDETAHTVGDLRLFLCHGAPGKDELGLTSATAREAETGLESVAADVLLCGHTHIPYRTRVGQLDVFNVGSVGMPLDGDFRPCYLSFFVGDGALRELTYCRVSYNRGRTVELLAEIGQPWAATTLHCLRTARLGKSKF